MQAILRKVSIALFLAIILTSATGVITGVSAFAQNSGNVIEIAQAADDTTNTGTTTPDSDEDSSVDDTNGDQPPATCESSFPGLGWILCQVARAVYSVFDYLISEVIQEHILKIDFSDAENDLKNVWAGFRTLANLVFVIACLIIIYSEATGRYGILETYSATRIIPRLFISVVGIQLSFYIVAYLVNFFNILGNGVGEIILAPLGDYSAFDIASIDGNNGEFFGQPVTAVGDAFIDNLIAVPAVVAIGAAAVILLPTILTFGVIGLLLLFITLIARKILVLALLVLSPVAFAAFILPGTEKLFRLWWDNLIRALAMYPLIMILISSGQLLGKIAIIGDNVNFIDSAIGFVATFLPLFMIPTTFKFAGSAVAALAGAVGNMNEKLKGDIRDPESMRARMRRKRLQRYGRMFSGDMRMSDSRLVPKSLRNRPLMPATARHLYRRLPGTNTERGLIEDYDYGRNKVKELSSTLGDDIFRAAAVTGGGRLKGKKVSTIDGSRVWSGYAQLGKHVGIDANGQIVTRNVDGVDVAQIYDTRTNNWRDAKDGDFYGRDVMWQVSKYGHNRGFIAASMEYAMTKANMQVADESQVWRGLDATVFTSDEKFGMAQGVWYNTKDASIHHKYAGFNDFFHDRTYDGIQKAEETGDATHAVRHMGVKFEGLTEFLDKQTNSYEFQNLKSTFWSTFNRGFEDQMTGKKISADMTDAEIEAAIGNDKLKAELDGIAWKANNLINQTRQGFGGQRVEAEGDDGPIMSPGQGYSSGSSATSASARGAKEYLKLYKRFFGKLPGKIDNSVIEEE